MDVSSLRLEILSLKVEPCKQFIPPHWVVRGNHSEHGAALHVIKGGEVIDTLKIDDNRLFTLFGRFPSCNSEDGIGIKLEHPSVSRVHAAIVRGNQEGIFVIDLGSSHGTFVSGKRVEPFTVTQLHDRSVVQFGQSTRGYIVRIFPKHVSSNDAEEANTLMNCMVGYKQPSITMEEDLPPVKLERRVSFSCLAPEIIPPPLVSQSTPPLPEGTTTPLSFNGGSPEVGWFRKLPVCSKLTLSEARKKSDSLPSIHVSSGSDEDEETSSLMSSIESSPILSTIDEGVALHESRISARKSYCARLGERLELSPKRVKPENL